MPGLREVWSTGGQRLPPGRGAALARVTSRAIELGFTSTHAIALRLRDQTIGSLNLFSSHAAPLADAEVSLAQGFADIATIALLNERALSHQEMLSEQLQDALHSARCRVCCPIRPGRRRAKVSQTPCRHGTLGPRSPLSGPAQTPRFALSS